MKPGVDDGGGRSVDFLRNGIRKVELDCGSSLQVLFEGELDAIVAEGKVGAHFDGKLGVVGVGENGGVHEDVHGGWFGGRLRDWRDVVADGAHILRVGAGRTVASSVALEVGAVVKIVAHVANNVGEVDRTTSTGLAVIRNHTAHVVGISVDSSGLAEGHGGDVVLDEAGADGSPRIVGGRVSWADVDETHVGNESASGDELDVPVIADDSVCWIITSSSNVVGEMNDTEQKFQGH